MTSKEGDLYSLGFRQGSVVKTDSLTAEFRKLLSQSRALQAARNKLIQDGMLIIVLSQDCDLSAKHDKTIEVLAVKKAKKRDVSESSLRKARNTRKLVVFFNGGHWLCDVALISVLEKNDFLLGCPSATTDCLDDRQKGILKTWRTNRYKREPLPDAFNQAFVTQYLQNEDVHLSQFLESNHSVIDDLYVYVWPDKENQPKYWVSLTVLLHENCSRGFKDEIKKVLREHVQVLHKKNNSLHMLQEEWEDHGNNLIPTLDLIAFPIDFSMSDVLRMKRLTLDYLCWPDLDDENFNELE